MTAHQPSYNYQNAQYQKYAPNGMYSSGARSRHYHYHQHDSKVYLGGLPQQITEADLRGRMSEFGTVVQANIICDEHGHSKGFGFVTFRNSEEAKSAIGIIDMYGKSVEVKYSNKNASAYHQQDHRHRTAYGEYPSGEGRTSTGYDMPYSHQSGPKPSKLVDSEYLHHVDRSETAFTEGTATPPAEFGLAPHQSHAHANQKSLSKKLLRKSSQQFENPGSDKELQKVHTPSEKYQTISEDSTRYNPSIDGESNHKGSRLPPSQHGLELSSKSNKVPKEAANVAATASQKRPDEPHRTISKHSNPYHPPVSAMPSVMPASPAINPSVGSLEYNPPNFGIYFNPQQNMYTQPGMGFMMNQFMNFGPVFEPVAAVEYPRPVPTLPQEDSPSLPAVETRIHFYTFPGRI